MEQATKKRGIVSKLELEKGDQTLVGTTAVRVVSRVFLHNSATSGR